MKLLDRILDRRAHVCVVGLGYVGLPLSVTVAGAGFRVSGIDLDSVKVEKLRGGQSTSEDVPDEELLHEIELGRFMPTTDSSVVESADVIVICVPTPLKADLPDMSYIEGAATAIASHLKRGQLIILESTTYPGTTEEVLLRILESSGLKGGRDFFLGFSPERIDPGNKEFVLENVPKIVGGIDEQSTDLMAAFYGTFISKVHKVSSPKAAEMAKLLENTYRHVNIALVNEIAILCRDLGIDVWEVIDAAATKPFGFQPFYPGPGWGGHCIPVDPAYLSWRVRQMGATARFVELAREFNERMPQYVVQRVGEILNENGKAIKGASILIVGVSYKPDVGDTRESPALDIIERLVRGGANVSYNDPHAMEIHVAGSALQTVELDEGALQSADLVMILTAHSSYDWDFIGSYSNLVLDTRNAMRNARGTVVKL